MLLGKVYLSVNFPSYFTLLTLHNMHFFKIAFLSIGLLLLLVYNLADHKDLHKKAKNDLAIVLYSWITFLFLTMIV